MRKVLIAGGDAAGSAELYDPTTGLWTKTGALKTARAGHTEALLRNGNVLITGGNGSGFYLSSAELYDPATGAWTNTGALTINSIGHTATLLPNGKVLVAGGQGDRGHVGTRRTIRPGDRKMDADRATHHALRQPHCDLAAQRQGARDRWQKQQLPPHSRAGFCERELSISLYHEILEAATVASLHPPDSVMEFNEGDFERAAQKQPNCQLCEAQKVEQLKAQQRKPA